MADLPPPAGCSIDLDAPGKRIGHLRVSWSDDVHAYGVIPVPIAVIKGGDGPTALVTAGVHGDEYEGLVITRRLVASRRRRRAPSAAPRGPLCLAALSRSSRVLRGVRNRPQQPALCVVRSGG